MQKILCIDTCGLFYSIALLENRKILFEYSSNTRQMQCEELIIRIESMLQSLSISYDEINTICVTNGPGTFNGVRIGTSAAYGISIAKNIKVFGISTIDMILYKTLCINPQLSFPISVFFSADLTMGFIKTFDRESQNIIISNEIPQQINVNELDSIDHQVIKFDVNEFDIPGSTISNAAAAGMFFIKKNDDQTQTSSLKNLFYGKPPSIHQK